MMLDTNLPAELSPSADDLDISVKEVARLAKCGPTARWQDAIAAAIAEARDLCVPRARWLRLADADLEGLFASETPVATIARKGERSAFVATIGPALEERVQASFQLSRFLEAVLLDAAGSVAVEAVCDKLEARLREEHHTARFSPGYCQWSMQAQHRLFALLEPATLGVELLPSLLMRPRKSVTGLVVHAPAADLWVPPPVCALCDAQGCTRRQARYVGDDL